MVLGISTTRFFRVSLTSMYSVFISCPGEYRARESGCAALPPDPLARFTRGGPLPRSVPLAAAVVSSCPRILPLGSRGARRFPRTPSLASLAGAPCPAPFRSLLLSLVLVREYCRSGVG